MPLIVEGERVPTRYELEGKSRPAVSNNSRRVEHIKIAFINNMPDAALEDTEIQFFNLLDVASGDVPICVKLYSLPGIPRTERGERHLSDFYYGFDDLWNNQFDGVIITGTEPHQADLRNEPYWRVLADVFDWAERNTTSTVLSCLAAHASVLHSDGINRHPLPDKQFGVFESGTVADHALMKHIAGRVRFPHSRWNEVREAELTSAGYVVLAQSADAGVDTFVKKKQDSLFVHFQGHPEYGAHTLYKEYRRDIKRFINHERETYPTMPRGYFDAPAARLLEEFQVNAMADRREKVMASFPEDMVVGALQNGWQAAAACVYRNWVQYVLGNRAKTAMSSATSSDYADARANIRP